MTTKAKPQQIDVNHPDFIRSIKCWEPWHWAQLYAHMQGQLDAFFRRTLPFCDTDEIDLYITEVFSRAYADIQTYQGRSSLTGWIIHLAQHVARRPFRAAEKSDGPIATRSSSVPE